MLDVLYMNYIRTVRAKGQREAVVVLVYGLKNAAPTILTVIGLVIFTAIVLAAVFIPMVTGTGRILWKLILPNVISPLTVQASYIFAQAIISEASPSFLGAGIAAPAASWGNSFRQAETGAFQHRYRFFNDEPPHKPAFPANNTNGK